jgi:MFS transporter, putative metabolite:H+ symporter
MQTPDTVSKSLDALGFGRLQHILVWLCGSGWMVDGAWEQIIPVITLSLQADFPEMSSAALGAVVSSEYLGMAVGSVAWGFISDKFGRRPVFRSMLLGALGVGLVSQVEGS